MPILLCRVDDRLIHGQVVVGWGAQLDLDRVVVIDDELSDSEWEQDLYRAGLPNEVEALFTSVETAVELFSGWASNAARSFILTRDITTMRRLAEHGVLADIEVNLGGLHSAPGRERVLPYLFFSDRDRAELRRLQRVGVRVSAQDVPSARRIGLDELLEIEAS
ncbi:MAG: PTS sugar transporter subunit IIB [Gemmatimonadales bacterium]|jgi:PTS system mannose-specific IIB component/fructoselysine and glucoselysine-specific PTS system IIB component